MGVYAAQPYLLDLLASDAIWVSGFVAAGIAMAAIAGNQIVTVASHFCGRRTTLLLAAGSVLSVAGILIGLVASFWVALAGVLLLSVTLGVTGPVRSAYLHQVVPSEQRATVVSFDSMLASAGSIGGQVGLGAIGEARAVGSAFVVGGVATATALPLLARLRRLGGPADLVVGDRAGADSPCAASGLPAVSSVETRGRSVPATAGD